MHAHPPPLSEPAIPFSLHRTSPVRPTITLARQRQSVSNRYTRAAFTRFPQHCSASSTSTRGSRLHSVQVPCRYIYYYDNHHNRPIDPQPPPAHISDCLQIRYKAIARTELAAAPGAAAEVSWSTLCPWADRRQAPL
jgi:hypothetical protein